MNINKSYSLSFIETTNKFLGYGKPNEAKCFFIGSEEHSPFSDVNDFEKWKACLKGFKINNKQYYYYDKLRPATAIGYEGRISYLQFKLQNIYYKNYSGDLESFRNDINNFFCFWGNIKPIGDEKEDSWSEFNREITGYDTKEEYFDRIWDSETYSRKLIIIEFLKYLKNRIISGENILIFHFGSTKSFSPYNALLSIYKDLGFTFSEENKNTVNLRNNKDKKYWWTSSDCNTVWFTGHPGNDWYNDKVADEIVNQLCSGS